MPSQYKVLNNTSPIPGSTESSHTLVDSSFQLPSENCPDSLLPSHDQDALSSVSVDSVEGGAGTISSIVNVSNTIIGSGMLALPSAIASVGLFLGTGMIACAGIAAAFGLHILSYCAANSPKPSSFRSIATSVLPNAAVFFDLAVAIKCFGVSISYLIIIGDIMPSIMKSIFNSNPVASPSSPFSPDIIYTRQFWITMSMIPLVPLSFQRKLDALKYTSVIALLSAAYLLWIIIYYFLLDPSMPHAPKDQIDLITLSPSFFKSLSIFVFAYTCHQNILTVHNELRNNTLSLMNYIIFVSVGISVVLYEIVGDFGYLLFGRNVSPNVIQMFNDNLFVTGGRFAIVLLVLFSYPLQIHPSRASLDMMICNDPSSPIPRSHFILLSSFLVGGSFIISILVSSLDTVLAVVGATGSTTVGYILPGLFFYKFKCLEYEEKLARYLEQIQNPTDLMEAVRSIRFWTPKVVLSVLLVASGFIIMVICLSVVFLGI